MPKTTRQGGPELTINLIDPPKVYRPGDVILGNVVRRAHIVNPNVWVLVEFVGRTKSKTMLDGPYDITDTFRGRFLMFDDRDTTQTIYKGPAHVAPDGEPATWPFSITIPTHPDPRVVKGGHEANTSYLSLEHEDIAKQALPPSFYAGKFGAGSELGIGTGWEGFVEYYVEAKLRCEGHMDVPIARYPVDLRATSTMTPVADFKTHEQATRGVVSSIRLLPGMSGELSLKQKAKSLLGSSKIPKFVFVVQTFVPTVLQLEHPVPIPFAIRVFPDLERTTDTIRDEPQVVRLESLELDITARSSVVTQSKPFTNPIHLHKDHRVSVGVHNVFPRLNRQAPIVLPQGDDVEMLNLGEHMGLQLDKSGVRAFGERILKFPDFYELIPSFTSYSLRHTHTLEWTMVVGVADQTFKLSRKHDVEILGPCEELQAQKAAAVAIAQSEWVPGQVPSYDALVEETLPSYQEVPVK